MKPEVYAIIMGGGRGNRLRPLTKLRAKPAVPLAGKYRLVDVPISNCLHSGLNHIALITQFNIASLHNHIYGTYRFDAFSGRHIDILSAGQTLEGYQQYEGTADAVRKNLGHFERARDGDLFLILSGDQLYRMDYREIVRQHQRTGARVTIASKPVSYEQALEFGVMRLRDDLAVESMIEKPRHGESIDNMRANLLREQMEQDTHEGQGPMSLLGGGQFFWVNMGIYVFEKRTLWDVLSQPAQKDFGREVIPSLLGKVPVYAFPFEGYWRDLGTIRSFFATNLELTEPFPPFDFLEPSRAIYTHPRNLPASRIHNSVINNALIADGGVLVEVHLNRCVIGLRSVILHGSHLDSVIVMGQDHFETPMEEADAVRKGIPLMGIGKNCRIFRSIIDKNARIGDNVSLSPEGLPDGFEQGDVVVRDGILVVTKGGIVPANTRIGNGSVSTST